MSSQSSRAPSGRPDSPHPGRAVLISGSTGLIGSSLGDRLRARGDRIIRLTHSGRDDEPDVIQWDPREPGSLHARDLEGLDAVVHLAGESILSRWSEAKKRRIRDSRVQGTRLLAERLRECDRPPSTLICGSAIGYYGDRGDEILFETSRPGAGFLADVCREWETAAQAVAETGIRVVHLRTGVVLSTEGGALALMLPSFRLGLGAVIGTGRQYMSWISRHDMVSAITFLLDRGDVHGPVNVVSPHPVTQAEFAAELGRALSRPVWLRAPAFAIRLLAGQMADEMLLASTRVEPGVLEGLGFAFRHERVDSALPALL